MNKSTLVGACCTRPDVPMILKGRVQHAPTVDVTSAEAEIKKNLGGLGYE